jgi:hypothetical protein
LKRNAVVRRQLRGITRAEKSKPDEEIGRQLLGPGNRIAKNISGNDLREQQYDKESKKRTANITFNVVNEIY